MNENEKKMANERIDKFDILNVRLRRLEKSREQILALSGNASEQRKLSEIRLIADGGWPGPAAPIALVIQDSEVNSYQLREWILPLVVAKIKALKEEIEAI